MQPILYTEVQLLKMSEIEVKNLRLQPPPEFNVAYLRILVLSTTFIMIVASREGM
jgi:hypothetical protein